MQKVLALLEKNVQWIALGLGGIYLLWMVWGYVLQTPVSTELTTRDGKRELTLRNADKLTREGPAQRLQRAMETPGTVSMKVEHFAEAFKRTIEQMNVYPALAGMWTTSQGDRAQQVVAPGPNGGTTPAQSQQATLPKVPTPTYLAMSQGLSSVAISAPPAGGAQPADPNAPVNQQDRQWVSTSWQVPTAPMAAAFQQAKIPVELQQTIFLRVETVREERNGSGQWGNPVTVKPLAIHSPPPMPTDWQGEVTYADWATKNQVEIVQPSFYQVLAADRWLPPGYQPPAPVDNTPFDPAKPPPRKLTPDEIEQVARYKAMEQERKRQEAEQRRRQERPTRTPPRRNPPGGPGFVSPAPRDLQREALAQNYPPGGYPGNVPYPGPAYPGNYPPMPEGYPDAPGQPQRPRQDPALPPPPPVPTGAFNPAQQPNVEVWVHDDTVQPGKTYRYRIRYAIKNPLYKVPNILQNRKDADQFAIWSDFGGWSSAASIPDITNFFVAANMGGSPMVTFDVFKWQDGRQHKQTVRVGAGDLVGGRNADGVDFDTGWTVVDVRENQRGDTYVILMDADGNVVHRDFRSDQQKDLYQRLQKEAEAARLATVSAVPAR